MNWRHTLKETISVRIMYQCVSSLIDDLRILVSFPFCTLLGSLPLYACWGRREIEVFYLLLLGNQFDCFEQYCDSHILIFSSVISSDCKSSQVLQCGVKLYYWRVEDIYRRLTISAIACDTAASYNLIDNIQTDSARQRDQPGARTCKCKTSFMVELIPPDMVFSD